MTVPVDPIAVALLVTRALETLGIVHTIGGSIASSIAGEPRSTLQKSDREVVPILGEPRLLSATAMTSGVRRSRSLPGSATTVEAKTSVIKGMQTLGATHADE